MSQQPPILTCVETGTIDEVMEIVNRLDWLPEFGLHEEVNDHFDGDDEPDYEDKWDREAHGDDRDW